MVMRCLRRLTWPLPWWVALGPGLGFAVATFALIFSSASSWAYVAPARLSGMIGESVGFIAPVACAASAWVAERFTNRHSPIAWPILPRAAHTQAFRVLAVLMFWWLVPVAAGGVIAQVVVLRGATGGHFYPVQSVIGSLGFAFFIASGFLIGGAIARWHAPVWALVWASLWIWVIPIYSGGLFPRPSNNVEYFLVPGGPASDHRGLDAGVVAIIGGWWVAVLLMCILLVWIWYGAVARTIGRPGAVVGGAILPIVVAAGGVGLAHTLPSPFVDLALAQPVCQGKAHLEYCVTPEQRGMLDQLIVAASPAVDRMGPAWPAQIQRVDSFSVAGNGNPPRPGSIGVNVSSVTGLRDVPMDIGVGLAGLVSCDPEKSSMDAVSWALNFGDWLTRSPEARPDLDPKAAALWGSSDADVRTWYTLHSEELLACRYTGPGPS